MKFYSTRNKNLLVSLRDAVVHGLAPDNGLFMPEAIPSLPRDFFASINDRSFADNAFAVAQPFLQDDIPTEELKRIVDHTIQFDAPLVKTGDHTFALELFHGPTMAFKDFGARFMSQLLGYFAREQKKVITILVATSGDTGSAVANGFLGVENVRVVVLYPSGKVSDIQEKQFTTLGENITALEVDGTFDDCQHLVKTAFQDAELTRDHFLTSANSINIARLIPQSFYYFHAYAQVPDKTLPLVFSVPSGNFGNLTGGVIAQRMGLPVDHFVIGTNENDIVPSFLASGVFQPRPSVSTISNAMDVGNPSNFERLEDLFDKNFQALTRMLSGYKITEKETVEVMQRTLSEQHYLLDPHGAVGLAALEKYMIEKDVAVNGVFLETAHPGKFKEVVEKSTGASFNLPPALQRFMSGTKSTISCKKEYGDFKKLLKEILS